MITWTTPLLNSLKLWAMPCRATQDGWIMVESSDKMWSTGKGNGKPLQHSCFENPMNTMKRQKDRTLKDELSRSVGAQYATWDQWRYNSTKNEETEPEQKQHPVVNVTGDGSKVWCYKELFNSVQFSRSVVSDSATPWIAACQASLSITNSWSSLRLTSIVESVMPSSHLILCRPLLLLHQSLPASESFPMSQLLSWGGQIIGVSALASFLPKKFQGWSPSEWTGWIFLQSKGLSGVFSNTTVQKHQFFGAQRSSQSKSHIHTWLLEKP